jgi:prepilin peptidase CpaA
VIYFVLAATLAAGMAAWTDWRTGLIPNWLSLGAISLGILGHFGSGFLAGGLRTGAVEAGLALAGLLLCALAPGFMYWKGGMGGGDLKLFAAIGALCQPMLGIEAQMYGFVVAAIVVPARMAFRGELLRVLGNSLALALNPLRPAARRREVPPEVMTWFRLGPAIFAGMLLVVLAHSYELLAS